PVLSPMLAVVVPYSAPRKHLETQSSNWWAVGNCRPRSSAWEKETSLINDNSPPSSSGGRPGDAFSNTKNLGVPSKQVLPEGPATSSRVWPYSRGSDMTETGEQVEPQTD